MNDSRFAWKVGLFVTFGLALSAVLILNFTRGITLFKSTYKVHVILPTTAGLKPAADVMLAGVPIGKVASTTLALDGRSVDATVLLLSKYQIRRDAKFHIDALGFLGDQYIEVTPPEGEPPPGQSVEYVTNGERIIGEAPFNMQEAVRSISGLLDQGRKTMTDLDQAITNVNHTVLAAGTLDKVSAAISNFESVTEEANGIAKDARALIDSNAPPVHFAITNILGLSQKLDGIADQLRQTVTTNTDEVTAAVKDFRAASASLKQLADGLQSGQGVAGALLKDEAMRAEAGALITNLNVTAEQFGIFGERLNQRGLFGVLRKPKPDATNSRPATPPASGKH